MHPAQRRTRRRARASAGLLALFLGAGVAGVGGTAVAQDAPPEEATAEDVAIEASTLYVSPPTDALPPLLVRQVPPEAVCVLQPDLCPEASEPLRNTVRDAIGVVLDEARDLPVQPVPPDSAAVSVFGGATRYQTAVKFDAPTIPDGEEAISAVLSLPQGQPSYDFNSPLFRGIFLAVFQALPDQDVQVFVDELSRELQESSPLSTDPFLGIEACPLLNAFEPGGTPMASSYHDLPTREDDGEDVADVDCILGSAGVLDESGRWTFDLAPAVTAWASGDLDNHGLLLRPTGVPNLAFGDPDTSSNAQIVLDLSDVTLATTTAEPFVVEDLGGNEIAGEDGFGGDSGGLDLGADGFGASGSLPLPDALGGVDDLDLADVPDVAEGEEGVEDPVALDATSAAPAVSGISTPWWVWTAVPLLFGGAWLAGSALLAPAVGPSVGGGAMTRLLARHGLDGPSVTV